jgi:uncharacterized protein with GYD domain
MAKFLIEATYTADGLRGLIKDKPSGREAAIMQALAGAGGKLDGIYYALGDADVFVLCELPDNAAAAALSAAISASGMVRTKTTPLLTVAEADHAMSKPLKYRAPGA